MKTQNQISAILILCSLILSSCTNHFEEGNHHYQEGLKNQSTTTLDKAKMDLNEINNESEEYNHAQILIAKIDSIKNKWERDAFIIDSIQKVKKQRELDSLLIVKEKEKLEKDIEYYKQELKGIKEFNGNDYRGVISSLTIEVALFSTWGRLIEKAKDHKSKTIRRLGIQMKSYLKKLQIKEFPRIRSEYAKLVDEKLWSENIDVSKYGTSITFTGGIFASNRNIEDFQSTIRRTLSDFRFKRANYKWYEYDDEYTYYTIYSPKDSEIE